MGLVGASWAQFTAKTRPRSTLRRLLREFGLTQPGTGKRKFNAAHV
jgi:hypothetical protein